MMFILYMMVPFRVKWTIKQSTAYFARQLDFIYQQAQRMELKVYLGGKAVALPC